MKQIPTTVITGSLGAGKTTIIKNLVKQFPANYKTLWLKNEYGDVNIDSEVAKSQNIETKEILNGCLCCVLIGRLADALKEIATNYQIDRLIIETAGTAYPGPIVNEVNKVDELRLDGLVVVIDALNYDVFDDKSYLAKKEAQYVDLVIINKINLVDRENLDHVEDEVYDLYSNHTIIETKDGNIDQSVILGLDSSILQFDESQNNEHKHLHELEAFSITSNKKLDKDLLINYLHTLNTSDFYRIKGIVNTSNESYLLNYVLGRITIEPISQYNGESKITFIGKGIENSKQRVINNIQNLQKDN